MRELQGLCFLAFVGVYVMFPAGWIVDWIDPNVAEHRQKVAKYEQQLGEHREAVAERDRRLKRLNHVKVYVTRYGDKYHRTKHYAERNHSVGLGDALIDGKTACLVCEPVHVSISDKPKGPGRPPFFSRTRWWKFVYFIVWLALMACPFVASSLYLTLVKHRKAKPSLTR